MCDFIRLIECNWKQVWKICKFSKLSDFFESVQIVPERPQNDLKCIAEWFLSGFILLLNLIWGTTKRVGTKISDVQAGGRLEIFWNFRPKNVSKNWNAPCSVFSVILCCHRISFWKLIMNNFAKLKFPQMQQRVIREWF